jgi:uncharacterized membrane protein YfcA
MELGFLQCGIVFLGFFILGIAGFGSALIIVPLLAWSWPLKLVVPLVLLMDVPAAMLHTGLNFRQVVWKELPPLLPSIAIGSLAGVAFASLSAGNWPLVLLGLYVLWVGVQGLRAKAIAMVNPNKTRHFFGFMMGWVEAMFGTAGPVVLAWLSVRLSDPYLVRATTPMALVGISSIALFTFFISGSLSDTGLWQSLLYLLPIAMSGVWLGHRLAMKLKSEIFKPVIYSFLCISGLVLCARPLLA